jgi:hypothetical protein
VFRAAWTWLVPLIGAVAVFGAILVSTPPGFASIPQVVFFASRGPSSDAAAYALGAASALALVTLVVLAVACAAIEFAVRRRT